MSNLSLGIAAHNLAVNCFLKIHLLMFLCAHEINVGDEHAEMDHSWDLMWIHHKRVGTCNMRMESFCMIFVVVVDEGQISVGIFDDLYS